MHDGHFDIIIIGTGAGGATLAYKLAASGKKILLLERGDFLPREQDNWNSEAVFIKTKYQAKESWYDKSGNLFHPGIQYYVGGNTKVYGAALLRFRREDFAEVKHHGGISPAWPLGYDDFEPYYTQAEELYHVHGQHGIDPTEPSTSKAYRYPPVSNEPKIQELYDKLQYSGLNPFPLPLAILLEEHNGKPMRTSPCIRCRAFDGYPCMINAKADAQIICIEPILKNPNVTLMTNAYVTHLETDVTGKIVKTVHVEHQGEKQHYSADIVVVACGAINSAALLLRSANSKHPNGLANSSDVVGRNYMRHINSVMMAISKAPNPTVFQKTFAINDFYFGSDDWKFPLGHIQMLGKTDGATLKGQAPFWAKWLPKIIFDKVAYHSLDFWLTSEDLPDPNNRITLNSDNEIVLSLTPNNMEGHRRLRKKFQHILSKINHSIYFAKEISIAGTAHQAGTVRFGRDPKTSALDIHCKAHDLDNLYVVDGSFFVSIAAVNPSLTIMANALRVADHLLGG